MELYAPSIVNGFRLLGISASKHRRARLGFTLAEVMISVALVVVIFTGILMGYVQTAYRAEWSGYSLAAQGLAIQQLEQARSAKWDILDTPVVNEFSNLQSVTFGALALPVSGRNYVWATNYATISNLVISASPPVSVYFVRVDTVWPFIWKGVKRYYTNTVADYFAPDR